ncbi:MAG: PIN domain-containing protein [Spirosomataceae bacterium]
MNLLFDTNIILAVVRDASGYRLLKYLNPNEDLVYVSLVNVAEPQSIAFQNRWGYSKMQILEDFFSSVRIINISDLLLPTYIGIDAYSQRTHPEYGEYPFQTPRNMGKNDLWIAATASLLGLELITTDADFDHLHNNFVTLQRLLPADIQQIIKQ